MPGRAQARISRALRERAGEALNERFWLVVPVTLVVVERTSAGRHVLSEISDLFVGFVELFTGMPLWPAARGAGFLHRGRSYVGLSEEHAALLERTGEEWSTRSRLAHGPSLMLEAARSDRRALPLLKVGRDVWEFPRSFEAEVVEAFQSRGLIVHHQEQS